MCHAFARITAIGKKDVIHASVRCNFADIEGDTVCGVKKCAFGQEPRRHVLGDFGLAQLELFERGGHKHIGQHCDHNADDQSEVEHGPRQTPR